MSSSLYRCSYEACSFKSRTIHGLETHVRQFHRTYSNVTGICPTIKKREFTVSRVLKETNSRKRKDKDGSNLQSEHTLHGIGDGNDEMYKVLLPKEVHDIPVDNCSGDQDQEKEGLDMIAKLFLKLSNMCSEKTVNEVLKTLKKYTGDIGLFLEKFSNMNDIKEYFKTLELGMIKRNGFNSKTISLENGLQYELFLRNPVEVIKEQVRCTPTSKLYIKPRRLDVYSHPINSNLGNDAFRKAEHFIKRSKDLNVKWKELTNDGQQSFIGGLQLFSDKSQVSLSAGALSFYPLHGTLLNYEEECGREHITHGRTILAYLPVSFSDHGDNHVKSKEKKYNNRYEVLSALHASIEYAIDPLLRNALVGIDVKSRENDSFLCHLLLSSYIADNPEAEDMLSVKRGVQTTSPCYRCFAKKWDMPFNTNSDLRTLSTTLKILDKLKKGGEGLEDKLKEMSMFPIPPVLHKFPMIGIDKSVDIYSIFRFEPMHNLSLGISKLLKECAVNFLKDEERESLTMKTSNGFPRKFKSIKNSVLSLLNLFLHTVEMCSAGYGLRVDFSKEGVSGRLSGFFNENGIIGMIEASEYDSLDMVSPFLAVIIDRCCGNFNAEVTKSFTLYVDLVNEIFRRFKNPGWKKDELLHLSENIKVFKEHTYKTFSKYQPSRMGTSKWHSLDHLVNDLKEVGSISYLHAGLFENFHKRFKEGYRLTSKRCKSAMEETLKRQDYFISEEKHSSASVNRTSKRPNPSRVEASRTDAGILVRSGQKTSLNDLEIMESVIRSKKTSSATMLNPSTCAKSIAAMVGEDGISSLISMLYEKFEDIGIPKNFARHIAIQNPASAYISGYNAPSLSQEITEDMVQIQKTSHRVLQRVVAMNNFHGTKKDRRDRVMIEACHDRETSSSPEIMPVWFAEALAFLRICEPDTENVLCGKHSRRACPECKPSLENELCFVQFFDIVKDDDLEIDEVDRTVNCIRLKWQRNEGVHGKYQSSRQFGLVPVDSLRGVVHIVPADIGAGSICSTNKWRSQYDLIGHGEEGWPSRLFYVNRFYRPRGTVLEKREEN